MGIIYSIEIILSSAERYIPTKIYGTPPYDILVFGGNGGGRLFASRLDSEEILYLREGSVVNSTFNSNMPITAISSNFNVFLELLLADIEAFVTGEQGHKFLDMD